MAWALITGASEGLGREFARLAAKDGFSLVISARREEALATLAAELRSPSVAVEVIPADLSREGEAERLWHAASAGRQIGILVNNAGLGAHGAFHVLGDAYLERHSRDPHKRQKPSTSGWTALAFAASENCAAPGLELARLEAVLLVLRLLRLLRPGPLSTSSAAGSGCGCACDGA